MGNTQSNKVTTTFGSVNPKDGTPPRPGWYINKCKLIYSGTMIELLPNEKDFQKLNYGYLKTNLRVFYKGIPIHNANPNTFGIINRNSLNTVTKNPNQFVKLNSVLGIDYINNKKRLYHNGALIYEE